MSFNIEGTPPLSPGSQLVNDLLNGSLTSGEIDLSNQSSPKINNYIQSVQSNIVNSTSVQTNIVNSTIETDYMIIQVNKKHLFKCIERNKEQNLLSDQRHKDIQEDLDVLKMPALKLPDSKCYIKLSQVKDILNGLTGSTKEKFTSNYLLSKKVNNTISNGKIIFAKLKRRSEDDLIAAKIMEENPQMNQFVVSNSSLIEISRNDIKKCILHVKSQGLLSEDQISKYKEFFEEGSIEKVSDHKKKKRDDAKFLIELDELNTLLSLVKNSKNPVEININTYNLRNLIDDKLEKTAKGIIIPEQNQFSKSGAYIDLFKKNKPLNKKQKVMDEEFFYKELISLGAKVPSAVSNQVPLSFEGCEDLLFQGIPLVEESVTTTTADYHRLLSDNAQFADLQTDPEYTRLLNEIQTNAPVAPHLLPIELIEPNNDDFVLGANPVNQPLEFNRTVDQDRVIVTKHYLRICIAANNIKENLKNKEKVLPKELISRMDTVLSEKINGLTKLQCKISPSDLDSIINNLTDINTHQHKHALQDLKRRLNNSKKPSEPIDPVPISDHSNFIEVSKTELGNFVKFLKEKKLLSGDQEAEYKSLLDEVAARGLTKKFHAGQGSKYPIKLDEINNLLNLIEVAKERSIPITPIGSTLSRLRKEIKKINS